MQEFHKHTRYQNKCGLYFTLANESCGSFTLGQGDARLTAFEDGVFAQNT